MKCSIVMATHCRPDLLDRTLASIRRQSPPFEYELIVVDDSTPTDAPATKTVVTRHGAGYYSLRKESDNPHDANAYRNPGPARNFGYRVALGDVVICQSDDTMHDTPDSIERLVGLVRDDNFVIATVWNGEPGDDLYTGIDRPSPLFFLGAVQRRHIYAVGGNDEDFDEPGYEDNFFADCLIKGLGLTPLFTDQVVGIHQPHERPRLVQRYKRMRAVYERKFAYCAAKGEWVATGGSWPIEERTV